jgi:hypothetical protein
MIHRVKTMSNTFTELIEFYGGPVDGCADLFATPVEPFVLVQSAKIPPHNHWLVRIARMITFRNPWVTVPVYFYRLTERGKALVYEFVGFGTASGRQAKAGQLMIQNDTVQLQLTTSASGPQWCIPIDDQDAC